MYICHTCFPKRNQVHLICAPGSVYTHMIDKMSEISFTVFKRILEFNHLIHSCGRLEGLKQRKMITTRQVFVFCSHRHLTGGPRASKLIVVVVELASIVL
jgi:tRNA G37 N-methylase TrmD